MSDDPKSPREKPQPDERQKPDFELEAQEATDDDTIRRIEREKERTEKGDK